jgi:putative sterol carrier protein
MPDERDEGSDGSGGADAAVEPGEFLRTVVAPDYAGRIENLRFRIRQLERELADREAATTSIGLVITGDQGGRWFLNVSGGKMDVGDEPACPVLFSCHQNYDDWCALTRAGSMFGGVGSDTRGRGSATAFSGSRISRLRALRGTVQLALSSDAGRDERRVVLHFGDGEPAFPPQVTVSMREDDAAALRAGSLDPQAAFLQGRVKITGDVALAVQLGSALFL